VKEITSSKKNKEEREREQDKLQEVVTMHVAGYMSIL